MPHFKACLAALALLVVAGCSTDPEAALVGVWTPDPRKIELPETIQALGKGDEVKGLLSGSTLKLKADRTFTLTSLQTFEGGWSLEGHTVTLRPKENPKGPKLPEMLREVPAQVGSDQKTLNLQVETPFGRAMMVLLKSG